MSQPIEILKRTTLIVLSCGLGALATASALDANSSLARGWSPLVQMYGEGDSVRAADSLRAANRAMDTILARTEIDGATEKFVEESWEELSDFQLDDFYELLPHQDGKWREIGVTGQIQGPAFRIRQVDVKQPFQVTLQGPRKNLADFSVWLRAKPTQTQAEDNAFLLQLRAGFGIGKISWSSLTQALTAGLSLVATGGLRSAADPLPAPSSGALSRIRVLHPKLAAEDLEIAAVLHDAFPATSEVVGQLARIDDLRAATAAGGYRKVRISARFVPERIKQHHPQLAKHLRKLKELAHAKVRWVDTRGRSLLQAEIDTQALSAVIECYVKEGQLLPFTRDGVAAGEPIDPLGSALAQSRVLIDAKLKMLGLVIHLDQLRVDLAYTNQESQAHVKAAVKTVPGIRVEGAALGFVPSGLIDAFIPGNIESLTRDLFTTAVRGNEGRGVSIEVDVGAPARGQLGAVEVALGLEALDNFMVKTGVGIVNQRMVPDEDESRDIDRLNLRLHQAFSRDFERFATSSQPPG